MSTNEIPKTNSDRARRARNRENAIQRGSLHAVRHSFTGQVFLMTEEDLVAYQRLNQEFFDEFKPQGMLEAQLVQFLADTSWRLSRIPAFERKLLVLGVREQIQAFATVSMHVQRLSDHFERTLRQLRRLQSERQPPEKKSVAKRGFVSSADVPRSSYPC